MSAYERPVADIPHPVATSEEVARWTQLRRALAALAPESAVRTWILEHLMEPRRSERYARTDQEEYEADAAALQLLAFIEQVLADHIEQGDAMLSADERASLARIYGLEVDGAAGGEGANDGGAEPASEEGVHDPLG